MIGAEAVVARVSDVGLECIQIAVVVVVTELESERRWVQSFASSPDQLATLADEALRAPSAADYPAQSACYPASLAD